VATKSERAAVYTEGEALNAIAKGYAAIRSSTVLVTDAKGASLSLSVTNASKAIPAPPGNGELGARIRTFSFWADVDFFFRFNVAADITDGAFVKADDIVECIIDPTDPNVPTTIQAVTSGATGTLKIVWGFGH
jgi:hypothetical protein